MEHGEKQHPFQNFDSTKLTITPRGEGQPARETSAGASNTETTVIDEPEGGDEAGKETVDKPGAGPKSGNETNTDEGSGEEGKGDASGEEGAQGTEGEGQGEGEGSEQDGPINYTEEDFRADVETFLTDTTQGQITKPEQILSLVSENASLKEQLKNKQLEFPSERAKKLYEFAVKNDGNELAAAGQYLRVQSLDLATLSPKEKQFEGFVLSRPDLTREEAKEIFELRYNREFADIETDVEKKDEHKVRTMEAEKKILAMQEEFKKVPERTASAPEQISAEDMQKITTGIDQSLSDFGGLALQFGDKPEDQFNVPMPAEEVSAFREALINPNKFLERIMDSSMVNGKFNNEAYRDTMFKLWNFDRIVNETRANGLTAGQVLIVKDRKNTVAPKGNTGTAAPPKKSYAQSMSEAIRKSEGK